MAESRDEPGGNEPDQWGKYQRRNQLYVDHQPRADNQQRKLLADRLKLRRIGDQFHCRLDGDECAAVGITVQPTSQTNGVGTTATFTAIVAKGTAPLYYQWQLNGANLVNTRPY